jgi:hypothetical protein
MTSYSESEAVAKDFREALEDIQTIGRPEISNLTIIARENIEHALAISGALVDHIKRVGSRIIALQRPLLLQQPVLPFLRAPVAYIFCSFVLRLI